MPPTDDIRLAGDQGLQQWPLAVPRALFTVYQPVVGGMAVLTWLNLYEMSGRAVHDALGEVARRLNVSRAAIEDAMADLEAAALARRVEGQIVLQWPADRWPGAAEEVAAAGETGVAGVAAAEAAPAEDAAPLAPSAGPAGSALDEPRREADDAGLRAVVAFYHQRIGLLGPTQFEKLRFWIEEMGLSSDVVALAIEETVQNAKTPSIHYLEGVLRNWYNQGVRTVADLQKSKQARASALKPSADGGPGTSLYEAIDRDAVRRWKEMYADEYDG